MKILVADDHAIFRAGLRLTLGSLADAVDVEDAHDLASLLALADRHPDADAIVVDLRMPGMDRYTGLAQIRQRLRQMPVLVLSASDDPDDVYNCLAAGASGYVHKTAPADTLFDAIRTVCAGGVHLPRELLAVQATPAAGEPAAQDAAIVLTPRQRQVFDLVIQGFANKRIAYDLAMSEGTVKAHVASIMRQYGVGNRVQLLRAAERAGLLASPRSAP